MATALLPAVAPVFFNGELDDDFVLHMTLGEALHIAQLPERALAVFEKALALAPENIHAVSACAALLSELARPDAAYRLLQGLQARLMTDVDGLANLAIAAEGCGEFEMVR